MRSTDNLNLVPKHIMTSLSESPCLIIGRNMRTITVFIQMLLPYRLIHVVCGLEDNASVDRLSTRTLE